MAVVADNSEHREQADVPVVQIGAASDVASKASAMPDILNEMTMPPRLSLWTVYMYLVVAGSNFVVVIPTAERYARSLGGGLVFHGLLMGAPPTCGALAAIPTFWFVKRYSIKTVFFWAELGMMLGNILYSLAGVSESKWTLLASRMLLGCCMFIALPMAYINRAVGIQVRSSTSFMIACFAASGYAVGPLIAFLLQVAVRSSHLDFSVFDSNTVPGWFFAIAHLALACTVCTFFVEPPRERAELANAGRSGLSDLPVFKVAACLFTIFTVPLLVSSCEVFSSLLAQHHWGWSEAQSALYLACVVGLSVVICAAGSLQAHRITDGKGIFVSFLLVAACSSLMFDYRGPEDTTLSTPMLSLYTVGMLLTLIGLNTARGWAFALSSKIVATESKQWMATSAMLCFACGRGLGAFLGGNLSQNMFAIILLSMCSLISILIGALQNSLVQDAKAS
eukprot:TRINITY_DN114036_c0_g1_i1.p1 TRINITY_DN114036_c0_g1~~TRINITY_DN114036_c0_g1_i1.p1  ORF type:complete len:451 (+),score=59.12 TRINITY_DN114036_c0_g1_i1:50-1402(+)